jgi:hypothetical protein
VKFRDDGGVRLDPRQHVLKFRHRLTQRLIFSSFPLDFHASSAQERRGLNESIVFCSINWYSKGNFHRVWSLGLCANWTQQRRAKKISLDDRAGKCQTPEALAIALSSKQAGCVATINIINFNFFDFLKASKRA